ncbi:MAG TPA: LamG-like jellyroll fold domain-containing protein [Bacteroidia bacterium]|nr:LamG-like jellyroll fold domain-containing protein [Bacteroidia bacterium]
MKKQLLSIITAGLMLAGVQWANAQTGTALNFDGVDDYASSAVFSTRTNNLTLEARVNWAGTTSTNQMLVTNGNTATSGYAVFVDNSNSNQLSIVLGGNAIMQSTATLTVGSWNMVSVVRNSGTWMLYIDGVAYTLTSNTAAPNAVSGSFVIGADQAGTENFNGTIDEVRFWNRPLCQNEIQSRLSCSPKETVNGLIAYYNFNEGVDASNNSTITTVADSSGNSNNLTLTNFALNGATSNWLAAAGTLSTYCGGYMPPMPTLTVTGNTTFCMGDSVTLDAGAGSAYLWSDGTTTTQTITIKTAGKDSVTITNPNGCYGMVTTPYTSITVNALPTVTANSATVCAGTPATLTANAPTATSYSWSTTETTMSITPTPTLTTHYTVTVTDANNCTNWTTDSITVNALPTLTITPTSYSICASTRDTLRATGTAISYTWSPGTHIVTNYSVRPNVTTTYTLTGVDANGCINSITQLITVYPRPSLTVTPSAAPICVGATTTLSAVTGSVTVTSYSWSTTETTSSISVTPTITTTYSVTGTTAMGCTTRRNYTLTVNQLPIVTATSDSAGIVCQGRSVILTGSGATTYTWSNNATTNTIVITPTVTTTYTVTGTDANSCVNMATVTQSVSTTCIAGIEQHNSSSNVSVYPNPSNGVFVVTTNHQAKTISVVDVLGNELVSVTPTDNTTTINLNAQANGVYFVKIISDNAQIVKRIVVNN